MKLMSDNKDLNPLLSFQSPYQIKYILDIFL